MKTPFLVIIARFWSNTKKLSPFSPASPSMPARGTKAWTRSSNRVQPVSMLILMIWRVNLVLYWAHSVVRSRRLAAAQNQVSAHFSTIVFWFKHISFSPSRLPHVQTLKPNLVSLPTISWSWEQPILDSHLDPHTPHQLLTTHTHFMIPPISVARFWLIQ